MSDLAAQLRKPDVRYRRRWTDPVATEQGGWHHTVKRVCNGCGAKIGDVTREEVLRSIEGLGLPDVTAECPFCTPGDATFPTQAAELRAHTLAEEIAHRVLTQQSLGRPSIYNIAREVLAEHFVARGPA